MLPGSRMLEVVRMLPIFLHTIQLLRHTVHELSLVIPVAPHQDVRTYVEKVVQSIPIPVVLIPGESLKERYDAFNVSSLFCLDYMDLAPIDRIWQFHDILYSFREIDGC
jgi:lipid-A-disaccharide synthase